MKVIWESLNHWVWKAWNRMIRWGQVRHLSSCVSKAEETETAEKVQVWRAGMEHTQSLFVELNKHRSGLPSDQCLETKDTLSRLVKCGVEVLDCWCWEPGIETGGVTAGERWNLNRALLECNQIHGICFTRLICQLCSDICRSAWVNKTLFAKFKIVLNGSRIFSKPSKIKKTV